MTTASCGLLVGVVSAADERVRERLLGLLSGDVAPEVGVISKQLRSVAIFATHSGSEEMTLVLFVVAAVMLFGFMLFV